MKNICACDNGHYNVQQGMSWSQCKQQNEKCLQIKDLNAKWDIWETWIYQVRLYMKWTMTLDFWKNMCSLSECFKGVRG